MMTTDSLRRQNMGNNEFSRSKTIKYLAWTFLIAYLIQIGVWMVTKGRNVSAAQLIMAAMMFVPTLGVFLAGGNFRALGWNPQFKKNIKTILLAWFGPMTLMVIGALLYFLIFPGHFDMSGDYLVVGGETAAQQLAAKGLTYPMYIVISCISSVTYAPLINTFVSLGEEIGWRGFLYPQLTSRYGKTKGRILGGVIWGAWHWPLIWLIGYEYGEDYFGFPVVGMLLFCVITVAIGVLCDRSYEKSGSIWLPSLFHGAFNAAAGIPLMVCIADTGSGRLLGPAPNGLISGLPMLIIAAILLIRGGKDISEGR